MKDLQGFLKERSSASSVWGYAKLVDVLDEFATIIEDLQSLLQEEIEQDSRSRNRGLFRKKLFAMTHKKKTEEKKEEMDEYAKAMETRILTKLGTSSTITCQHGDQRQERLSSLSTPLKVLDVETARTVSEKGGTNAKR